MAACGLAAKATSRTWALEGLAGGEPASAHKSLPLAARYSNISRAAASFVTVGGLRVRGQVGEPSEGQGAQSSSCERARRASSLTHLRLR